MLCTSVVSALADRFMTDDNLNAEVAKFNANSLLEEVYDETDDFTEMVGVIF